jgi:hypothetical protein
MRVYGTKTKKSCYENMGAWSISSHAAEALIYMSVIGVVIDLLPYYCAAIKPAIFTFWY